MAGINNRSIMPIIDITWVMNTLTEYKKDIFDFVRNVFISAHRACYMNLY